MFGKTLSLYSFVAISLMRVTLAWKAGSPTQVLHSTVRLQTSTITGGEKHTGQRNRLQRNQRSPVDVSMRALTFHSLDEPVDIQGRPAIFDELVIVLHQVEHVLQHRT